AIPFVLTIAAFHGPNARGTSSASFIRYMDRFRAARVGVVKQLGLVPIIDDLPIADSQQQRAIWLEEEQILLLDREWVSEIEAVADVFSQLIEREGLKYPLRKGLSDIWPENDDDRIGRVLSQMDLAIEHYREAREHWRGDLGPTIERLCRLMWVLS